MFAVLKTGGKQYKVAKNDIFLVEKLVAEAGETVPGVEVVETAPRSVQQLGTVSGVGAKKLETWGPDFLDVVRENLRS